MNAPEDRPLIYIAGPYTRPDPVLNVHRACLTGDLVWNLGGCPLIPHPLTHTWHLVSPAPFATWLERDLGLLARCDGLLRLPGESTGADAEVQWALDHGIPVARAGTTDTAVLVAARRLLSSLIG